jgi:hypothetical protein
MNSLCIKTRVSIHSLEQYYIYILPHGQVILPGFCPICLGDVGGPWAGSMIVFILGLFVSFAWACVLLRLTHQLVLHQPFTLPLFAWFPALPFPLN